MRHTLAGVIDQRLCIGMVLSIESRRLWRKHSTTYSANRDYPFVTR
jgi:hypothetical protein